MSNRTDVLVLGGTGVDTLVRVPQLPLPFADSYMVPAIEAEAGQTGDGVAVGLRSLGLGVHLLDFIGDDPEGLLVRALHERHGVEFTALITAAGTKRAVNLIDKAGRRLSLYDYTRSDPADRFDEALLARLAAGARHAHVSITHPCQYALPTLRAAGLTISTDLHNWDGRNAYHLDFADQADVVFLSRTALPDHEAAMRLILDRGRAGVVVVTDGEHGGYVLDRADGRIVAYPPATPPSPAIDSNGAGDAFVAGYLYGMLAGEPVERCVQFGAVAGAHACTGTRTEVVPIDPDTLRARSSVDTCDGRGLGA
ncbi:MAG TPA: PfkB family carbohydrate kinase [Jatrophihabitans sp.]|nr:PfkB family carbohydrate kinase [Jatrophihabitans sp.]